MKKHIILLALFLIAFSFSCKNENKEATNTKSQMQKVIDVHDEVMPKMGTISKLINQIDTKIKEADSTEVLVNASQNLKDGNKAMMDWMVDFSSHFDSDEILKGKALNQEKQTLLDEDEAKINAVRDQINSSIKNAEELLN